MVNMFRGASESVCLMYAFNWNLLTPPPPHFQLNIDKFNFFRPSFKRFFVRNLLWFSVYLKQTNYTRRRQTLKLRVKDFFSIIRTLYKFCREIDAPRQSKLCNKDCCPYCSKHCFNTHYLRPHLQG